MAASYARLELSGIFASLPNTRQRDALITDIPPRDKTRWHHRHGSQLSRPYNSAGLNGSLVIDLGDTGEAMRARFGDFEVDLRAGQLRKRGHRIKLQDQPFRVLAALLEKPGEVVTREELQQRIWPDGTYVDFDQSLNKAVNKLRDALADSADRPRYIETLPRRGYRFIGAVERSDWGSTEPGPPDSPRVGTPQDALRGGKLHLLRGTPLPRTRMRRIIWVSSFATGVLLIAALGLLWWSKPSRLTQHPRVLKQLTRDAGLTTDPALSSDGKFLAYASDRSGDGNLDIWVQQLAGGEPVRLTRDPADEREPTFAPDGSEIAFRSEREGGGIYTISIFGGEPRLIAKRGHGPRFSPQGDSIVYWLGQTDEGDPSGAGIGQLRIAPSVGGPSRQLRSDFANAVHPIWSPDGKDILFKGARGYGPGKKEADVFDWWITKPDGTSLVKTGIARAFNGPQGSPSLDFSRIVPVDWERNRILFSAQLGDSTNLWQVGLSSRGEIRGVPERVTLGAGIDTAPSTDRAGHVAFSSLNQKVNVWSLPIDGNAGRVLGPPTRLTSGTGPDDMPSISADGKTLVYSSIRSGKAQIMLRDLVDGHERVLTEADGSYISRDGLRVAYTPLNSGVHVMSIRGGDAEKLCDDCASYWHWSSDGKKILFVSGPQPPWHGSLFDVESGRSTVILQHTEYSVYEPCFSPDDHWVSFEVRIGPDQLQLFVVRFRGSAAVGNSDWIPVTDGRFSDRVSSWSPNGQLLYFFSDRDGFQCLWAQRLDAMTKRSEGAPFAIYHWHSARLTVQAFSSMAIALDKVIVSLSENTANIWMTELE